MIHEFLLVKGVEAVATHGGKDQEERTWAIDSFKAGQKVRRDPGLWTMPRRWDPDDGCAVGSGRIGPALAGAAFHMHRPLHRARALPDLY